MWVGYWCAAHCSESASAVGLRLLETAKSSKQPIPSDVNLGLTHMENYKSLQKKKKNVFTFEQSLKSNSIGTHTDAN